MPDPAFATTRWSLVRRAHTDEPCARRALGELCDAYWRPIYAWLRSDGHDPDAALDLTQEFLAEVLERGQIGVPDGGRFRAYVVGAVRNFARNARRHAAADKRGGGRVQLDGEAGERLLAAAATRELGPDAAFERAYAIALLERAVLGLEREFAHKGEAARFAEIRPFLDGHDGDASYEQAAAALASTVGALRVAVHRARGRLGELIRAEIAQTLDDPDLVETELEHIRDALG